MPCCALCGWPRSWLCVGSEGRPHSGACNSHVRPPTAHLPRPTSHASPRRALCAQQLPRLPDAARLCQAEAGGPGLPADPHGLLPAHPEQAQVQQGHPHGPRGLAQPPAGRGRGAAQMVNGSSDSRSPTLHPLIRHGRHWILIVVFPYRGRGLTSPTQPATLAWTAGGRRGPGPAGGQGRQGHLEVCRPVAALRTAHRQGGLQGQWQDELRLAAVWA